MKDITTMTSAELAEPAPIWWTPSVGSVEGRRSRSGGGRQGRT